MFFEQVTPMTCLLGPKTERIENERSEDTYGVRLRKDILVVMEQWN